MTIRCYLALLQFILQFTTHLPIAIPPPPSNVKISEIRCRTAVVTWDEVANTTGYTVHWRLLDASKGTTKNVSGSGSTSVRIANLKPSTDDVIRQYTVRVTSVQQDDISEASQDVTFITNSDGEINLRVVWFELSYIVTFLLHYLVPFCVRNIKSK